MRRTIGAACLAVCTTIAMPAAAWDFPGHRIVGAIADLILLQHYPMAQQRVSELLEKRDGSTIERRTLSQVSAFPDCAKRGNVPFCGRPPSDEEKAYADCNRHHDKFHFTDVPLQQPTYRPGSAGTEDVDVVQMIAYAVDQLRGKHPPAKSDVNLTDSEAVWLLAHLVGDIHQPLHVGAKYFDKACQTSVDPNITDTPPKFGIGDTVAMTMGGNLILLEEVHHEGAAQHSAAGSSADREPASLLGRCRRSSSDASSRQCPLGAGLCQATRDRAPARLGNRRIGGDVGGAMGERDHAARRRGA